MKYNKKLKNDPVHEEKIDPVGLKGNNIVNNIIRPRNKIFLLYKDLCFSLLIEI